MISMAAFRALTGEELQAEEIGGNPDLGFYEVHFHCGQNRDLLTGLPLRFDSVRQAGAQLVGGKELIAQLRLLPEHQPIATCYFTSCDVHCHSYFLLGDKHLGSTLLPARPWHQGGQMITGPGETLLNAASAIVRSFLDGSSDDHILRCELKRVTSGMAELRASGYSQDAESEQSKELLELASDIEAGRIERQSLRDFVERVEQEQDEPPETVRAIGRPPAGIDPSIWSKPSSKLRPNAVLAAIGNDKGDLHLESLARACRREAVASEHPEVTLIWEKAANEASIKATALEHEG